MRIKLPRNMRIDAIEEIKLNIIKAKPIKFIVEGYVRSFNILNYGHSLYNEIELDIEESCVEIFPSDVEL